MTLTRQEFVGRAGAALTAAGLYGLLDTLGAAPARAALSRSAPATLPPEQHTLRGLNVVMQEQVEVLVPPLYHQVVTARLRVPRGRASLLSARSRLERRLAALDKRFPPTPAGLGLVVAWGIPYFRDFLPKLADGRRYPSYLPVDRRASQAAGKPVSAFLPAVRFPSDDASVLLEQNHLVVVLRSDSFANVAGASDALFGRMGDVFEITSVRKGFIGGGFGDGQSIPKQMATAAGIPGASLIPEGSQLFMGFTSTQRSALAPDRLVNFETLPGLTDQWPKGYFRNGTTMHISHLFEDLEKWWTTFTFDDQVRAVARPGLHVRDKNYTLPQDVPQLESEQDLRADVATFHATGHSGALQPSSRLARETVDNYGVRNQKGTPTILRADFNTLDNPFFWSANPTADRQLAQPAAGLHFVAFSPTSDTLHRARRAMDGRLSDGSSLALDPRAREQGFNSVIRATHRQNFLVPPRRHRAIPLAELA
jgi:hypothetical protein